MKPNTGRRWKPGTLKRLPVVLAAAVVIAGLVVGLQVRADIKAVPRLFERNAELKAQGYYMGEFEFKMLGIVSYLNEGRYLKAYTTLRRIRAEMETTRGLVKMPQEASLEEMMAFLLDRQYPTTGAFMDPSYPFFTYFAPTLNVVEALGDLARQTGHPLKLKYPLRFLDEIRTPEQLRNLLSSHLYLKETWAELGGPGPYTAVSELAHYDILEHAGVYKFSDEWKDALRQWFYDTQDPATGFWGFRIGVPGKWRQKAVVNTTWHILRFVLDDRGENRSEKYPLRYAGTLTRNILKSLAAPIPADAAAQHDWSLNQAQGARMITRYLWTHLSEAEQEEVRKETRTWLSVRYRLFRPADGGFAIYTSATRADVDGTGTALGLLRAAGSLPGTPERDRLWGKAIAAAPEPVRTNVRRWKDAAVPPATRAHSVRVYKTALPVGDTYDDANLVQIIYLDDSAVLDVMDLRQQIARFIATSKQAFGNWESTENLREDVGIHGEVSPIPVSHDGLDLARIAGDHPDARRFWVIGYDVLQVPVFRSEFVRMEG
jgi:hypothetical protein